MLNKKIVNKLDSFFKKYPIRNFKKGDLLIRANEKPKGIFYLSEGVVRQYAITTEGVETSVNIFKPVSFFPMNLAMTGFTNSYFYEAQVKVKTHFTPKDDVITFIKENPDVLFDLLTRVFIGLDGLMKRMEFLMSGDAAKRILIVLLIAAKRFGKKSGKTVSLRYKITHQQLATEAGIARETVSREMKKLENQGIIQYRKNFISIVNLAKFEEILFQ